MNNREKIAVEVRRLEKSFPAGKKELLVFKDLNFDVRSGETVCFLGPSGCGKSTLLRCIASLTNYKGSVLIDGEPPAALCKNKKIGFAFQDAGLIEQRTVYENIMLPSVIGVNTGSTEEAAARAEELMTIVGLEKFRNYYPHQLSGGMLQRTNFARSLLLSPRLLLLDEPFNALDSLTATKLTVLFEKILKEQAITTILISHNIQEAVYLADRIFILSTLPAVIIKEIPVNMGKEKSISLFDDADFLKIIAECRKELFKNEIEN
jgi:ABC-type nitrate/sulfonate/bicarbonate transport system ATPase subunit